MSQRVGVHDQMATASESRISGVVRSAVAAATSLVRNFAPNEGENASRASFSRGVLEASVRHIDKNFRVGAEWSYRIFKTR